MIKIIKIDFVLNNGQTIVGFDETENNLQDYAINLLSKTNNTPVNSRYWQLLSGENRNEIVFIDLNKVDAITVTVL